MYHEDDKIIFERKLAKAKVFHLRGIVSAAIRTRGLPSSKEKCIGLIMLHWKNGDSQREKIEAAYDRIVLGKGETTVVQHGADLDEVEHVVRRVVKELGGVSAEEARKTVEDVARAELTKLVSSYRPIEIKSAGKATKKVKGTMPAEFELILQLASARINTLLVGPAGCGKTYIAEKAAESLGLDFSSISCSAGMSESQLAGWLLPVGASGRFDYVQSEFVRRYESGGVFLLDEIDSADPNLLTFINKALAGDHFFIPQRHKKPRCARHKDFVCIAAANTFGNGADTQYVGRNQLDAATLDRFRVGTVYMDYSPAVEDAIIDPEVLAWGRRIRQRIAEFGLRRIMSTRVMKDLTTMKAMYKWGEEQWNRQYFAGWDEAEMRRVQA